MNRLILIVNDLNFVVQLFIEYRPMSVYQKVTQNGQGTWDHHDRSRQLHHILAEYFSPGGKILLSDNDIKTSLLPPPMEVRYEDVLE